MSKVVSNKRQLRRMVELMQQNLDIARSLYSKHATQPKWEEFTKELNKLGPPQREWDKWVRVWADLKCKIKRKNAENKATRLNGSRINPMRQLSDLEEKVIEMLDFSYVPKPPQEEIESEESMMTESTEDVKFDPTDFDEEIMKYNSYETLEAEKEEITTDIKIEEEQIQEQVQEVQEVHEENSAMKTEKPHAMDDYKKILEDQTTAQKQFYDKMTDLMTDMKRSMSNMEDYIYRGVQQKDDLLELKRMKLKAYKEAKNNKSIDRKAKLKINAEILAMKKKKQQNITTGNS